MHPTLNIAVPAARRAGDLIVRNMDRAAGLEIGVKGRNDYVTEVDRLAESVIIDADHQASNAPHP